MSSLNLENAVHAFVPLFVAIDVVGLLPIFISFTDSMEADAKKRLISQASLTALVIGLIFLLIGRLVFVFLSISPDDFRIAGGVILLMLAISDIVLSSDETPRQPSDTVGVVPIGIPLIMGPGALATILIMLETVGFLPTLVAVMANLIIVWFSFQKSEWIVRLIGRGGSMAFSKVAQLLMAGIAVKMVREGFTHYLSG